jgi:hypothetical protein
MLAIQPPPATENQRYEHSPYRHHLFLMQISQYWATEFVFGMSTELKT